MFILKLPVHNSLNLTVLIGYLQLVAMDAVIGTIIQNRMAPSDAFIKTCYIFGSGINWCNVTRQVSCVVALMYHRIVAVLEALLRYGNANFDDIF